MRASHLLTLSCLLLVGCSDVPDQDWGYGTGGPADLEWERRSILIDLARTCREGDRQACDTLDRAIEERRRQDRYSGPLPSLSERNLDQRRRDQERYEEKSRRQRQLPNDLSR
ncbi:hypothetical protein N825_16450 [Skermanella stibiiresistens SB22]|uniref:Lipoprotein n=1 Tax=Skermanella stibiiresistens SB22 TaxID=1385369 RepID=W9GYI8_9PROT|nr:hypothetical protein [Skermanella stibiiresistens]EWY37641.1 hypothetical protein N825_16450 [Skermanella stibiiresistens SB22]